MVHQGAGFGIPGHMADGETVLDYVLPCPEALEDDFMAAGNVRREGDAFHHLSLGKVLKGYRHVVGRIDFDVFH